MIMKNSCSETAALRSESEIRAYQDVAQKITQEMFNSKYEDTSIAWNDPENTTATEIEHKYEHISTEFSNETSLAYWRGTLATLNWVLGHDLNDFNLDYPDDFFDGNVLKF